MFGHPAGLKTLFFTELWERLSYYGMRAILVLFLVDQVETGGFGMSDATAGAIYGLYTAFVYLLALPGGWIADRLLGLRRAVFLGGCIIAAGHFSMAIPTVATFYLGLVLIVIGTGLLKPNVSAMVAELYPEGGSRRDAGFSIYYMGINIGAFIGPIICGKLGQNVDWHLGFSAAGIGMVLGLIQYRFGMGALGDAGAAPPPSPERDQARRQTLRGLLIAGTVIIVGGALIGSGWIRVSLVAAARSTGVVIVSIAALYFAHLLLSPRWSAVEKKRIGVILILFMGSAVFWSGFEQAGSSMNLFAERLTRLSILGAEFPASWLQSVNPFFIIVLAPVFGWLWIALDRREPSIPGKFAAGLLLLASGFLVLAWGSTYASESNRVSPTWLVVTYFLHTAGELCLSPVGLSSMTKLAPRALVGQVMGLWFTATALGNLMAGVLGGLFAELALPSLFGAVAGVAAGAGILVLIASRPIRRLMGDIR